MKAFKGYVEMSLGRNFESLWKIVISAILEGFWVWTESLSYHSMLNGRYAKAMFLAHKYILLFSLSIDIVIFCL